MCVRVGRILQRAKLLKMNIGFYLIIAVAFLVSGCVAAILIPGIVKIAVKKELYDLPDERHIHVGLVPRLGGVAFFPAMLLSLLVAFLLHMSSSFEVGDVAFLPMTQLLIAGVGGLIMYLTGVADDLVGVRYRYKFLTQALAASLMCFSGVWISNFHGFLGIYDIPAWFGVPFTVLVVMLVVNSINLIDGIDGLSSGLCIMGITAFAVVFILNGYYRFAILSAAALGCLVPFYCYNVFGKPEKRNKIFMGDTGTLFMGYLLAFLAVKATTVQAVPEHASPAFYLICSASILLLPALDLMRVFFNRIKRGRNPFMPDKTHIHHKFLALDFSMRQARWIIFLISALFFVMNMLLAFAGININIIFIADVVFWCVFHVIVTRMIMKRYERPGIVTINTDLININ